MTYPHLSQKERYQIQALLDGRFSRREIAEQLGRNPSTIAREIARNAESDEYDAGRAHVRSLQRRHIASARPRISLSDWAVVEARMGEQ